MRNDVEKYWYNSRLSMILHMTDIRKIEIQFHSFFAWSLSEVSMLILKMKVLL